MQIFMFTLFYNVYNWHEAVFVKKKIKTHHLIYFLNLNRFLEMATNSYINIMIKLCGDDLF